MLQSAGLSIPALVPTCFEEPSYTNVSRPQFQSVFQSKAQNYPSSARFVQEVRCSVNEENFANFLPDLQSSLSLPSWMPWHQRQSLPYFGHPHGGDPYYAYGYDMVDVDNPKSFPQKRKRARTTFSVEQLKKLEKRFQGNHYIVGDERLKISKDLNLSEAQVKVWFQNRRIKFKRDQELEKLGKTKKRKGEHHMRRWQLVTRNFGPETNELFCTARDRSEPFVL